MLPPYSNGVNMFSVLLFSKITFFFGCTQSTSVQEGQSSDLPQVFSDWRRQASLLDKFRPEEYKEAVGKVSGVAAQDALEKETKETFSKEYMTLIGGIYTGKALEAAKVNRPYFLNPNSMTFFDNSNWNPVKYNFAHIKDTQITKTSDSMYLVLGSSFVKEYEWGDMDDPGFEFAKSIDVLKLDFITQKELNQKCGSEGSLYGSFSIKYENNIILNLQDGKIADEMFTEKPTEVVKCEKYE